MRDVYQYLDWVVNLVESCGAEDSEVEFSQSSATKGKIIVVIYFYDGSRLEITEGVQIINHRPVKVNYVYQYVSEGKAVFRYDNARHHPELPNFPHHKHVGRKRVGAFEPSLQQVLEEVVGQLKDVTHDAPKRQRTTKRAGSK